MYYLLLKAVTVGVPMSGGSLNTPATTLATGRGGRFGNKHGQKNFLHSSTTKHGQKDVLHYSTG